MSSITHIEHTEQSRAEQKQHSKSRKNIIIITESECGTHVLCFTHIRADTHTPSATTYYLLQFSPIYCFTCTRSPIHAYTFTFTFTCACRQHMYETHYDMTEKEDRLVLAARVHTFRYTHIYQYVHTFFFAFCLSVDWPFDWSPYYSNIYIARTRPHVSVLYCVCCFSLSSLRYFICSLVSFSFFPSFLLTSSHQSASAISNCRTACHTLTLRQYSL